MSGLLRSARGCGLEKYRNAKPSYLFLPFSYFILVREEMSISIIDYKVFIETLVPILRHLTQDGESADTGLRAGERLVVVRHRNAVYTFSPEADAWHVLILPQPPLAYAIVTGIQGLGVLL